MRKSHFPTIWRLENTKFTRRLPWWRLGASHYILATFFFRNSRGYLLASLINMYNEHTCPHFKIYPYVQNNQHPKFVQKIGTKISEHFESGIVLHLMYLKLNLFTHLYTHTHTHTHIFSGHLTASAVL